MKKILLSLTVFLGLFSSALGYSFSYNDKNLEYNPDELKFYEGSRLLDKDEIQKIFPEYEIVLISKFDKNNKYKMSNSPFKTRKILLLNDTDTTFHLFFIYPETSRYQDKNIKSLITIYGKKNVRLKHSGGDEFEIVVK